MNKSWHRLTWLVNDNCSDLEHQPATLLGDDLSSEDLHDDVTPLKGREKHALGLMSPVDTLKSEGQAPIY